MKRAAGEIRTGGLVYFESLNGFRGLAALFILLFHSLFVYFRSLWIGVPMFFVLSGFLITRILIEEKNSTNYFKAFYFKRALRILPIYYLALLLSVFWGLLVKANFNYLPLFLVYLQNFIISQDIKPEYCYGLMNHTWSLSVEELFYLVWPVIVLFTARKPLVVVTCCIGVASILYKALMLAFFYHKGTDQLLLLSLPGNLDGLMAGALLGAWSLDPGSFINTRNPLKQSLLMGIIFSVVFTANFFHYKNPLHFSILKQSLSVLSVLLSFYVIWLLYRSDQGKIRRFFFHSSFMQMTGKISYGLYLYHALIFGITDACLFHFRISIDPWLVFVLKVVLSYAAALFSWSYIEQPFLRMKDRITYQAS